MSVASENRYKKFCAGQSDLTIQNYLDQKTISRSFEQEFLADTWRRSVIEFLAEPVGLVKHCIRDRKLTKRYDKLIAIVVNAQSEWASSKSDTDARLRAWRSIQYAQSIYALADYLRGGWKFELIDKAPKFITISGISSADSKQESFAVHQSIKNTRGEHNHGTENFG